MNEHDEILEKEASATNLSEEAKKEKTFVKVVRSIRNKFTARRLIGNIYVYRVAGFVSTAMRCKINESYYFQRSQSIQTIEDIEDVGMSYKRAITMTDTILDSLERRALNWDGVDFNNEVMLTRGAKFSISGPFIGIIGYQLLLEISATVQSLIDSRRRYEIQRSNSISSQSGLSRGMSFSFFSKNNASNVNANTPSKDTANNASLSSLAYSSPAPADPPAQQQRKEAGQQTTIATSSSSSSQPEAAEFSHVMI
jgi:hypothetical protein